jgi:hypothetical protein
MNLYKRIRWFIRFRYYKLRFVFSIWKYIDPSFDWTDGILHINMQILLDFYNHGKLSIIDWASDFQHCNARIIMEEIYEWYTITYPQREEEIEVLLDTIIEHRVSWWGTLSEYSSRSSYSCIFNKYANHCTNLYYKHLDLFEKEKEEMLKKLLSIKNFLWT